MMANFDYAFTLVGLILGLSVTEVLSGLVRTVRKHRFRTIEWLTPLLGLVVICDLTTYWGLIADYRQSMPGLFRALAGGVLITSLYYVAASMVFPDGNTDLNEHYFKYKRGILALVVVCNLLVFASQIARWRPEEYAVNGAWIALMAIAIQVRGVRANYVALGALLIMYAIIFALAA
jgi:hypothetical protein